MKKYKIRIPKHCIRCRKQYFGSIDPTGQFCTKTCAELYGPLPERATPIRRGVEYPFNCIACGIKVSEDVQYKRCHKRKLCKKKCRITLKLYQTIASPVSKQESKFNKESKRRIKIYGDSFYSKSEWLEVRYNAFLKYGRKCLLCGSNDRLHVDHIKPRSRFPALALDINNLQILCEICNLGKSNKDMTDWRQK